MIITYMRSSSYGRFDMCEFQYYLEYVLGWRMKSGKAADIGTISHKVMEFLAQKKKAIQANLTTFRDEETNKVYEIDTPLENFIEYAWDHYTKGPAAHHKWDLKDKKKIYGNVYDYTTYNNGNFNPLNMQIIECEQYFDYTIEEDWAKYEYKDDKGNVIQGNLAVKGVMDLVTHHNDNVLCYTDWKGLPIETEIPTPSGWTTMGNLLVGSQVFDKDGNITTVIGKSQQNMKPCYKITFDDTTEAICDNQHLWTLSDGSVVDILNLRIGDKIDVAKPLSTENKKLPIDPYLLGIWLGDGRNRCGEIASNDDFIFNEIQRRGYVLGDNIGGLNKCISRTVIGLTKELRKLNLLHDKHIPIEYLRSSLDQRLDLLRGLMDSDGNANPTRKQAVFTSCNKKLSDSVKELLLTLGQRPNQGETIQKGFGLTVTAYPLHFRPINLNPFLLPRKANQIDQSWGNGLSDRRLIKKIEQIEDKVTQCIMVDSVSSTYLCTKNMIPTHNTGRFWDWGYDKPKTLESLTSDFQPLIYHYALTKLFPQYKLYCMTFFYNNDGGPRHMVFEKDDTKKAMQLLKKRFLKIKNTTMPTRRPKMEQATQWKCSRLCDYGKIKDINSPYYKGKDEELTICDRMYNEVQQLGLERVTNKYADLAKVNIYRSGGGVSDRSKVQDE